MCCRLDAALKKLTHKDMNISSIAVADYDDAFKLTKEIKSTADAYESEIYAFIKQFKKLKKTK